MKTPVPGKQVVAPVAKGPAVDPLEWIGEGSARDILQAMDRQKKRRTRRRVRAASACLAVMLVAAFVFRSAWQDPKPMEISSAQVHVPERQVLPDGSVVELRRGAVLKEEFTAGERRVALLAGEAHFSVAKNPARPFVVAVGDVAFRAVGTAFSVDRRSAEVELLVTEGKVAVDRRDESQTGQVANGIAPSAFTVATLQPGERTVVPLTPDAAAAPAVQALAASEVRKLQAWRVPRLEFSSTPLAEAVAMINEHSPVKLVLADPSLGSVKVSGVLRADNIETLRELLAEAYQIKSEYRSPNEVVLSRAK